FRGFGGAYPTWVFFSSDSQRIGAFSQQDGIFKVWDATTDQTVRTLKAKISGFEDLMAFSPNGQLLAMGRYDEAREKFILDVCKFPSGEKPFTLASSEVGYSSLAFSPDGRHLAAGEELGGNGKVMVWDVTARRERFAFSAYSRLTA